MDSRIDKTIKQHLDLISDISQDSTILEQIQNAIDLIVSCFKSDHKVLICGNGGSAADSEHIAAELSGKFNLDRKALFAEALHVNSAALTAISNDFSYSNVFSRMLEAKARKGDVLLSFSTSGKSPNIIKAVSTAKSIGCSIISFSGEHDTDMFEFANIHFKIPSNSTARIQEAYMLIAHIICEEVEIQLFKED